MAGSVYDPGLFERYLKPKEQLLAQLEKELRKFPLRHPSRRKVSERVRYLKHGISDLKAEYAKRNAISPVSRRRTGSNAVHEELAALRRKLDELVAESKQRVQVPPVPKGGSLDWGHKVEHAPEQATWDTIEIWFISDNRVEVRRGKSFENLNDAEFRFQDRRDGKPNRAWAMLRALAKSGGVIAQTTETEERHWPNVEKRIQEIRKVFRGQFGISSDPIPFVEGSYQAQFKIGCRPSFHR